MNKRIVNTGFLLAALLLVQAGFGQDKQRNEPKFKKTKSYSKSYALSSSDKVNLSNQFGEMKLVTWDKNEIKVDISITGKSDEETRAQQILDKISIEDNRLGNTVSFATRFADDQWNNKKQEKNTNKNVNHNQNKNEHQNEGMDIDYVVYLPTSATLKAENQFGDMIIPDYKGEVDLNSQFGSLVAGRISNVKEVTVGFGKVTVASMNGGKLNVKFSDGNINRVSGDVRTDFEFSQVKLVVDNDIKSLVMNNSYTTTYLDLDKNLSASFDISTSHGSFDNKTGFAIKEQNESKTMYGPSFNNRYTGTSGSGGAKLKVSSSFGEVIAGHNLQVDMTDKKKNKRTTKVI